MIDRTRETSHLSLKEKHTLLRQLAQKRPDTFPLSFAQHRLWFLDQLEPGSPLYNMPFARQLSGDLNVAALRASLDEIVRRHATLRTTFSATQGQPSQVVAPARALPLPIVNLSALNPASRELEMHRLIHDTARRPFDLARGPLLRTTLLQLDPQTHVLLLTMHHIISDGWSIDVFFRELAALYGAFSVGQPSPLAELPIQYADFAVWQREWLLGQAYETQLAYWKEQLRGAPAVLELPTDRPRPAAQSHRGAFETLTLPRPLVEKLKAQSRQTGTTLFMTLLAAFKALLYRYTGQTDLLVGIPIANRRRTETQGLIGFFINTLALRADLSGNPTFRQLLDRVRQAALGAYAHQDLPFEKLVQELQPERRLSHAPLLQVLFALEDASQARHELPGLTAHDLPVRTGTAKFDMTVELQDTGQTVTGAVEYRTDLFDAATIRRLLGHFQTVLAAAAADPETRLSDIPLLTDAERDKLLGEWNQTVTDYPREACVHELFAAQAARTPDAVAVVYAAAGQDQHVTYRELDRRADRLARHLRGLSVSPGTLVGICLERSPELIVGTLGILKAGGAYVPLDPTYPQERLAFMLADTAAPVLLTQRALLDHLPAHEAQTVCIDADEDLLTSAQAGAALRDVSPVVPATGLHSAYVMYTSGSTGRPKGIVIPHRAINRLVFNTDYVKLEPGDRVAQAANASFDAATFEIWGPLLHGARVVGVTQDVALSPHDFAAHLQEQGINTLFLTTALFNQLARSVPWAFGTLRHLLFGGEAVDPGWVREVLQQGPPRRLLHVYGPTESTTFASWHLVPEVAKEATTIPIGRPIANTQIYLLDGHLQPVPIGVPGELYVGGDGLALGYLQRPALTAERFIPHPFVPPRSPPWGEKPAGLGGQRLYKTGDLVRYRPDGSIEFLGRIDHQIKLRGFRIELGEIETALIQHPALQAAVVQLRQDAPGKRLAAYIVPRRGQALKTSDLHRFLSDKLPGYMIPSAFVTLEALPLTPNGKVDRRALPAPERVRPKLEEAFVAPRTPVEELLAGIWSQVLGIAQLGVHDSFFELGGHSLLATRIVSRVRDDLQIELPVRALFEAPTIARLARRVELARQTERGLSATPIRPADRTAPLPLSFAQQRLWFLDQLEPGNPSYNMPAALRLTGRLDVPALAKSLNEIVRRHESLRTTFAMADAVPVQVIAPVLELPLPLVDLTTLPASEREAKMRDLIRREVHWSFDLARGPLVRATLARLDRQTHVLILNTHHIVSDGWSMGVLLQELGTLYRAFCSEAPFGENLRPAKEDLQLPELPVQYADFGVWQREWLQGQVLETQLTYWKKQLGGRLPLLELPTDRPRPPAQTYRGDLLSFELPQPLSEALRALSRDQGCTLFMTLLAAFKTLLHRYSGQSDVIVGAPISGRNRSTIEGLIGFFVNTLVLRTDFAGNPNFQESLARVREVTLDAYAHQDLPFEKLLEELQPARDLSRTPLFQVFFNMINLPESELELPALTVEHLPLPEVSSKFDMTLYVGEAQNGGLQFELVFNADLFAQARMVELAEQYRHLLRQIADDPQAQITDYSLVTPAARGRLPDPALPLRSRWETSVQARFAQQVRRVPQHPALVDPHATWTYKELNARSNQLAHYLRDHGLRSQDVVAIHGHRSAGLVWAVLGVLKAGAAFLILDPAYPAAHLIQCLQAARPQGWLQIGAADEPSDELAAFVAAAPYRCRLPLPDHALADYPTDDPSATVGPDELAYVAFTSGSTGQPKGILGTHRPLPHFLDWHSHTFGLDETDRFSMLSGLSHDPLLRDILTPLWLGATLCIPDPEQIGTPGYLADWMARREVTITHLTPAMGQLLTERAPAPLPALRYAFFGGDALTRRDVAQLRALAPTVACVNFYGTTETPQAQGYFVVPSDPDDADPTLAHEVFPVGRGITDVQLLVLNAAHELAGVGELGEICVRSPYLARGYLEDDALTRQRFISPPSSPPLGGNGGRARLYKTGDLGRYQPDGNVEFLGRADHQVKIRGFRIELGEVEAVLKEHLAVQEAVVTAQDIPPRKQLVAYLVPRPGQAPSVNELRRFFQRRLPDHMVPATFVTLPALPLTPSGKVDRLALPAPDGARPELEETFVPPGTPLEEIVAEIWQEVLRLESIGVHDDFFDLGGHSLLATQVVSRVRDSFEIELPVRVLFEAPTVAQLAARVEATLIARIQALDEEQVTHMLAD